MKALFIVGISDYTIVYCLPPYQNMFNQCTCKLSHYPWIPACFRCNFLNNWHVSWSYWLGNQVLYKLMEHPQQSECATLYCDWLVLQINFTAANIADIYVQLTMSHNSCNLYTTRWVLCILVYCDILGWGHHVQTIKLFFSLNEKNKIY